MRTPRFAALVFLPLVCVYVVTMDKGLPYNIDAQTNALTAWQLGTHGTPFLDDYFEPKDLPRMWERVYWVTEGKNGHIASKYPPGASALAAPLYALLQADAPIVPIIPSNPPQTPEEVPLPPLWPASTAATLATAAAMTFLGLVFRDFVSDRGAVAASWLAGLGTTAWPVAAEGLWQHGPAMMWIALGMLLVARERLVLGGSAFGAAVLTRPQVAPIAAIVGFADAWRRRSVRNLAGFGFPAALGAAAYLAYNLAVFGTVLPSDAGGYFVSSAVGTSITGTALAVARSAFDPRRGFFLWSSFLLPLVPGIPAAYRVAPAWVRASAAGGVAFLVVQMTGNIWTGGEGHVGYRYPLEMLTATAPLLVLSYREWVSRRWITRRVFVALCAASVTLQAVGAFAQ